METLVEIEMEEEVALEIERRASSMYLSASDYIQLVLYGNLKCEELQLVL